MFKSKEMAEQVKKNKGWSNAIILSMPWTVLIGQSASNRELDPLRSVLKLNDYDGYTVKAKDGEYRLLTGAFVTQSGAKNLVQGLIELGLSPRVVRLSKPWLFHNGFNAGRMALLESQ
jgi:hypothetical protein